jgi:hypothetical protein
MEKNITTLLLLLSSMAMAQIRPFDNSKAILPWLYNPAVNFTKDFQVYVGYDGRGSSSFTPQSVVAGLRMPVVHGKGSRSPHTMIGVQVLNTKQDLLKQSTINATFSHQIDINKTTRLSLGMGAGIFSMNYNLDDLVYIDQQDPLLNNAGSFYNVHLNAGAALVLADKFFVNLAAPYLLKDSRANFEEIILRMSYLFPLGQDVKIIPSLNLDTYNKNMIYGGDLKVEWRKVISVLAGADRFKYHGGILLDVKPVCIGYTYGQNFDSQLGNIASHQISVYSHIVAKHNNF